MDPISFSQMPLVDIDVDALATFDDNEDDGPESKYISKDMFEEEKESDHLKIVSDISSDDDSIEPTVQSQATKKRKTNVNADLKPIKKRRVSSISTASTTFKSTFMRNACASYPEPFKSASHQEVCAKVPSPPVPESPVSHAMFADCDSNPLNPLALIHRLNSLMKQSQESLKLLQEHDKKNGLPASHCTTMVKSYRSRKQLMDGKILKKWDGTPLIAFEKSKDGRVIVRAGDKKRAPSMGRKSKLKKVAMTPQ